jgi:hypothetical protein
VPNQQHGLVAQTPYTTNESLIVVAAAITMQFNPVVAEHLDEIQSAGPMGVSSHLNFLSRCEPLENLLTAAFSQGFELEQLLTDVHLGIAGQLADLIDLLLQLHQRLFKLEQGASGHGGEIRRRLRGAWAAG